VLSALLDGANAVYFLYMRGLLAGLFGGSLLLFAASPASSSYTLKSYDIGSGGTDSSTSANYSVNGTTGTQTGAPASSASYSLKSGENPTQDTNVTPKPTLTNPDGYYDRLKLVVNNGANPTTTKFLIAISSDNFTTIRYVQTDNSIAASYTLTNYQSYVSWGGASGFYIMGLTQGTTYEVKVRPIQGNFSEAAYSPKSDPIATLTPSLSFGIATTLTGTPPFLVGFASLSPNSIFAGDADGTLTLSSNAKLGGTVYIKSLNAGLKSNRASFTVNSGTVDLSIASTGYGAQVTTATQITGGPFTSTTPYNGSANNVGALSTTLQPILLSGSPVFGASATIRFKAKTTFTTPAETDYTDTVTVIAAMNY
jgi:hypothetical protein